MNNQSLNDTVERIEIIPLFGLVSHVGHNRIVEDLVGAQLLALPFNRFCDQVLGGARQ